jgi:hypothetical protein
MAAAVTQPRNDAVMRQGWRCRLALDRSGCSWQFFITKAAKGVKLAKQESLIRAFGHERRLMRPVSGGGHGSIKPAAS